MNPFSPSGVYGLAGELEMNHMSITAMFKTYGIIYCHRVGMCDPGFREELLYRHLRGLDGRLL
jgi:hypothetical protein